MNQQNFSTSFSVSTSPEKVFHAINNVRGWWSEEIEGSTENLNDEFNYHYQDVHRCKMKIIESVPGKKVVWFCEDNYFSFTEDKTEWIGTKIIFDISEEKGRTILNFTHEGLMPTDECYEACKHGWTQYIDRSLLDLINTGKGQPNAVSKAQTTHEVAARFNELAQQEKWFEIQDELFENDVKSIEPENSPYFEYAEGKATVRKKGEDWVKRITAAYSRSTTAPLVCGNHFAVGRSVEIEVIGHGRIKIDEIMMYEVKNGKIISEQFFY